MAEYFAGQMLKASIAHTQAGVRDLRNPDLSPFFSGPAIPSADIERGVATAQEVHQAAGIEPISASAYAVQAGPPSQQFFLDFLGSAGIETTFENDITIEPAGSLIPSLGFRTAFIKEQSSGRTLTVPAIRETIRSRTAASREDVQHLAQPKPLVVADSDPFVRPKLRGMRQYVTRYLTP